MNTDPLLAMGFRDIHAAPPPSWWPPAPGWWLAAAVLLALLGWLAVRLRAAWRRRVYRRRILAELDTLADCAPEQLAARVSVFLRRLALAHFDRARVAPLSGRAWLAFLDATGGGGGFVSGPGRVLARQPYAPPARGEGVDAGGLLALARHWAQTVLEARA